MTNPSPAPTVVPRATAEEQNEPLLLHETKALNPWMPEVNPLRLAVLGKLAEELNEAGAIVSRCIIQGVYEAEPVTGKVNRDELEKEIADVYATATMAVEMFALSSTTIARRMERKIQHLRAWHDLIRGLPYPSTSPDARTQDTQTAACGSAHWERDGDRIVATIEASAQAPTLDAAVAEVTRFVATAWPDAKDWPEHRARTQDTEPEQ